jgi:putative cell wall-binding protein
VTTSVDTTANVVCGETSSFSPFAIGASRTTRYAGVDRYETAARASAATFDSGVPVVYVASGSSFADALAAGPAAAEQGGPILLTAATGLPDATRAELQRLQPKRIVVVGGSAAVKDGVVKSLAAFTTGSVERVAGVDRYATAAAISRDAFDDASVVYIATGSSFPDALAGGPLAAKDDAPVLLVGEHGVSSSVAAELRRLDPDRVVVLGGTAAVSEAVSSAVASTAGVARVERLAGRDRYETATVIARRVGSDSVFLATGLGFADALSGAPVAAERGAAIVLVQPDAIQASTKALLTALEPTAVTVLGGSAAVSRAVELDAASTMRS